VKFAILFAMFIQAAAICAMGILSFVLPAMKVVPSQSQSQEAKSGSSSPALAKPEPGYSTAEMRPTPGTSIRANRGRPDRGEQVRIKRPGRPL
jgi:hypothetical protein